MPGRYDCSLLVLVIYFHGDITCVSAADYEKVVSGGNQIKFYFTTECV